jgi:hypothetical protein
MDSIFRRSMSAHFMLTVFRIAVFHSRDLFLNLGLNSAHFEWCFSRFSRVPRPNLVQVLIQTTSDNSSIFHNL